jgi:hypothetical protein
VKSHPEGSIYHHPLWLKLLEKSHGHKIIGVACEDRNGKLLGVLPLCHTRGLLSGSRLASLPHTPTAGPLARDEQSSAALLEAGVERAKSNPGTHLQIKASAAGFDQLVASVGAVPWEATYILKLPERLEDLRFGNSRNHSRIKWAVGKAGRMGVRVRLAETERDLRKWYLLYLETMRWHRIPPRPYRFFSTAWELLHPAGLMRVLLAEQHGSGQKKLLAGSVFLMSGHTVFYAFNGRHRDALSMRPNDVIQWQAIHDACREGYRHFDFGEVGETNDGLAEFKSKWGAEPSRLYRYYYPKPRELETGAMRSGSQARQLANAVWGRLPLKATALIGDLIYSHL